MSLKFKSIAAIGALIGTLALAGCGQDEKDPNHIKVGVIVGAEQQVAEVAQKVAKEKYGLDVELVTFNDYVLPNEALSKGDIDLNAFQHKPYLDQQIKDRGYKLVSVGNTFVYPIAAYSKKIKSLSELQDGAQIALPNDPTNLGRSLLLLQKQGLIKLKDGVGLLPTSLDVAENPKNLKLVELEAPQLPRSLDDQQITLAIINTTYASQIGLTPAKDGLFVEDKDSPYVNLLVAREDNKDAENVKKFVQAYQTDEVNEAANKIFNGGAVKGW
ncbi:D-methionine transport system substrate-binding protein [Gibbsiella quercinecans]|uniref:Lipoprotein n=1 Tax=Gibbsiella quercinecans TaxID=929813 RepID=A0A250B4N3_9GAMM|nr:MetQ/NlpA family lipoprotein [Gibbsiella quercinecans]ATA20892.1 DL-methionine transporter substrate-binding subunit [Gibbsiella quercinecans]RLM08873.1 methionine ABC transporter substrate-binding protein MetQ [Gibbsiella quercinecans]RLM10520.1 methionine ABC transporter substrate-binding protein MetQ [Gibbsiella quercinecans]RLM14150.1 methionine ABC transporter substrate-binding protein MetQ [Gibbsiella quercinecans]TCT85816.1 D-methionine transport system substrate-binding protein [Gib